MYSKIQDFITLHELLEYEYKYEKAVVPMAEVVVMEPCSFEEIPQVIQSLRKGKSVLLNLKSMDPEQAQRAVDFVAGGTYAIKGHQERVAESLFLFTPICVQVTIQEERCSSKYHHLKCFNLFQ